MPLQRWSVLSLILPLLITTLSCGDSDSEDNDLRVVQQADILRAKLGQSVKSSFTLVNPTQHTMHFVIESQTPKSLLNTALTHGTIAPKSARDIAVTVTCPMQDGQFLIKLTAKNDIPNTQPVDIFLRLQCGWAAADPETIGNLLVIIDGLPENMQANITIEGPDGTLPPIHQTTTLRGLPLGKYTLTAAPILANNHTLNPAPFIFKLPVTNDNKARAQFTFEPARESQEDD